MIFRSSRKKPKPGKIDPKPADEKPADDLPTKPGLSFGTFGGKLRLDLDSLKHLSHYVLLGWLGLLKTIFSIVVVFALTVSWLGIIAITALIVVMQIDPMFGGWITLPKNQGSP